MNTIYTFQDYSTAVYIHSGEDEETARVKLPDSVRHTAKLIAINGQNPDHFHEVASYAS